MNKLSHIIIIWLVLISCSDINRFDKYDVINNIMKEPDSLIKYCKDNDTQFFINIKDSSRINIIKYILQKYNNKYIIKEELLLENKNENEVFYTVVLEGTKYVKLIEFNFIYINGEWKLYSIIYPYDYLDDNHPSVEYKNRNK